MAHVGKLYPVHFRRDFSLDLTSYRFAMPKAFWLRSLQTSGVVGNLLFNKVLPCIEVNALTSINAEWESDVINLGGRMVHATINTKSGWPYPDQRLQFEIFDGIQGSIGKGELFLRVAGGYARWNGVFDPASFVRPLLLTGPPSTAASVTELTWAEWNAL